MATSQDVMPPEEAQAIAAIDEAKRQIEIAVANQDVDSLLEWRDRAAAVQHYIRRRDEARELADNAGELKVRAEAALGRLDLEVVPKRGRRKAADEDSNGDEPVPAPLADFQTARRSMFRTLGKLAEDQLDSVVESLRSDEDDRGVTTARAVKAARDLLPHEERAEREAPTKEQRRELVSDYVAHLRALDTETNILARMARKVLPAATPGERTKMVERLSKTVTRLEELREALEVEAEPEEDEGE